MAGGGLGNKGHAYDPRAAEHEAAKARFETVLSGPALVRFAWLSLWAFIGFPPTHAPSSVP